MQKFATVFVTVLFGHSLQSCQTTMHTPKIKTGETTPSVESIQDFVHRPILPDDPDTNETTLASFRITRSILMNYIVDMKANNNLAPAISNTIQTNDSVIRECYSDRLDTAPKLKGRITYEMQFARNSPTIRKLVKVGGTIVDRELDRCLVNRMMLLQFDLPKDMRGTITYLFDANMRTEVSR